jgi:hypothetical protein
MCLNLAAVLKQILIFSRYFFPVYVLFARFRVFDLSTPKLVKLEVFSGSNLSI